MLFFLLGLLLILVAWAGLVYLRKTMWDAVHRNLLDLEDHYHGKVIRRSFAARPVFHGEINGAALTLNFSTEKLAGQRLTYIDLSLAMRSAVSFTLSERDWLKKQQAGSISDATLLENDYGTKFLLRPVSQPDVAQLAENPAFMDIVNHFKGLAYLFIGRNGLLCEWRTEEVIKATELENMDRKIRLLQKLTDSLAKRIEL